MKTLYKFLGLFVISSFLVFTACEDYDQSYTGDAFIHFSVDEITIVESSTDTITLTVHLADAPAVSAVNLTLDVGLTTQGVIQSCVKGVDFDVIEPADLTSITIPAGSNSAEIKIVVFDNLVEDSAKYITLTLASAGAYIMGYPGSEIKKVAKIEISDDDCAFKPGNFTGTPIGTDFANRPSQAVFVEDASWSGASATKARFAVTGLMGGQFAVWGETVSSGATFYLILDFSDPLAPDVSIDLPAGDTGHMIETNGGDWGYFVYDNDSEVSTFSTCGGTLIWYYYVDLYQNGSIYGGGAGVKYWKASLSVTFEL